jgi:hypothetical protein
MSSKPLNRHQLIINGLIKNYDNASTNRRNKMVLFIVYHVIQKAGYDNLNRIITRLLKIFKMSGREPLILDYKRLFTEQVTSAWNVTDRPMKKADKIEFVRKVYQLVLRHLWSIESARDRRQTLKELPVYITNALELGEQGIRNGTIKYRNNRTTATIAGLQKAGGKSLVNAMSNSIKRDKNNFDKQYKLNKNLDMFYKNLLKIEGLNKK